MFVPPPGGGMETNMRYSRQNKILDIINNNEVDTQEKLVKILKESGYNVTQATISRDIKELQLIKTLTPDGMYKYAISTNVDHPITERLKKIFKDTIQTVTYSGNIVIVKTLSGCGAAAGEAIDSLNFPSVLGTVAGDNTIMVVVNDPKNTVHLVDQFNEMLEK